MPWVSAEMPAADVTRYQADLPILAYGSVAANVNTAPQWRTSGTWSSGSDITHASYYTQRVYDGHGYLPTRAHTNASTLYLLFDFDNVTFDTLAIIGHNFASLTSPTLVAVAIADDTAFSTRLQTLCEFSSANGYFTDSRRFASVTLGQNFDSNITVCGLYSSVRYLRIGIAYGNADPLPYIGELFLGVRQTLPNRPELPVDEDETESRLEIVTTNTGVDYKTPLYTGRTAIGPKWRPDSATYAQQFRDFHEGTGFGETPFLWIPNPYTAVRNAKLMRTTPRMIVKPVGGDEREVIVPMVEQKPFCAKEL